MWPDCPTVKAVRIRNIRRESARICSLQSVVLGLNGLNLFELTISIIYTLIKDRGRRAVSSNQGFELLESALNQRACGKQIALVSIT